MHNYGHTALEKKIMFIFNEQSADIPQLQPQTIENFILLSAFQLEETHKQSYIIGIM